jgi:lipopolysaccharide/colanic/teichoic acid biosynthesis glycosyltransferase
MISATTLPEIRRICDEHEIKLDFVPELVGLQALQPAAPQIADEPEASARVDAALPKYFASKRYLDLFAAVTIIVVLSPLWLLVGAVALWNVGSPIFFWQQRLGQGGRPFLLYKIRTLKPPFDWYGRKLPDTERLTTIGRILRMCRFDELPQLLNVLVGEMSLIGPRPLLPRDQPHNSAVRLSVRPGITGWAQVNGGNFLSVEEKGLLDEWYIRNASLRLDLSIIFLTLRCLFQGERRSESAIAAARAMHSKKPMLLPYQGVLAAAPVTSPARKRA